MKRLLICTALLCVSGLITAPANAADRGFALLDNVPIADTPQLVNSSADTAAKPAVINGIDSIDNDINLQMAMGVATLGAVGQQSALSHTALNVNAIIGDENRGSSSTPGTKRVGLVKARYSGDRFTGDSHPALRPDPHLMQAQVLS